MVWLLEDVRNEYHGEDHRDEMDEPVVQFFLLLMKMNIPYFLWDIEKYGKQNMEQMGNLEINMEQLVMIYV